MRSQIESRTLFTVGKPAARVGDEVITFYDLETAYRRFLDKKGMLGKKIPEEWSREILKSVLNEMIERSLILQEAKRDLKDPKKYKEVENIADKVWHDEELPPLLKRTGSVNIYELKQKMAEKGESIDEMRQEFRLTFVTSNYMQQKLGKKMTVELVEMRESIINLT